jgi:hypothetical protein
MGSINNSFTGAIYDAPKHIMEQISKTSNSNNDEVDAYLALAKIAGGAEITLKTDKSGYNIHISRHNNETKSQWNTRTAEAAQELQSSNLGVNVSQQSFNNGRIIANIKKNDVAHTLLATADTSDFGRAHGTPKYVEPKQEKVEPSMFYDLNAPHFE